MKKVLLALSVVVVVVCQLQAAVTYTKHKVQPKQNLFRISLMYNTTVPEIVACNPAAKNGLAIGQVLRVPTNTKIRDAKLVSELLATDPAEVALAQVDIFNNKANHKQASKLMQADKSAATAITTGTISLDDLVSSPTAVEYSSDDLITRWKQLKEMEKHDRSVKLVDMRTIKVPDHVIPDFAEPLQMVNQSIELNKIMVLNLQIKMKDGSVITLSNPEEQKKLLAQIMGAAAPN